MPDGAVVDIPDTLTPELAARLSAMRNAHAPQAAQAQPQTQTGRDNYSDVGAAHPTPQQASAGSQAASMSPGGFNNYIPPEDRQAKSDFWSGGGNNLALAHRNFQRPLEGIWTHGENALHAMGLMSDKAYARESARNKAIADETKQMESRVSHPVVNQLAANPLNFVMPGAGIEASVGTKVGMGALTGAAFSGLDPDSTPLSTATGAILGIAAVPAAKLVGWVGAKAASVIAEKFPTLAEKLGIGTRIKLQYAGAQELKGELDQAGIPSATWADVTGDPVLKAQQEQMAMHNPKMQANRLQVNQEALDHVKLVVNDLKSTAMNEGWGDLASLQKAAEGQGKRAAKANAILTAINNSGDDWKKIVQNGGNLSLFMDKLTADAKFDLAEAAANPLGRVLATHLKEALEDAVGPVGAERGGAIGSNSAEAGGKGHSLLQKIQLGVEGKPAPPIIGGNGPLGIVPEAPGAPQLLGTETKAPLVGGKNQPINLGPEQPAPQGHGLGGLLGPEDPAAQPPPTSFTARGGVSAPPAAPAPSMPTGGTGGIRPTQDMTFGGLRRLRSSINDEIARAMKGTVVGGQKGLSAAELTQLQRVSEAIEHDLQDFAETHPEVGKLYNDASSFYKQKVVPFKDDAFGKALADTDPTAAAKLFGTKDPAEQQRFFNLLPPKSQKAVRWGLMQNALDAGDVTQAGVMGRTFNSSAVAKVLEGYHHNGTMGVAFPGGEDSRVALGMAKILRTVANSDSARAAAPNSIAAAELARTHPTMLGLAAKAYDWATRDNLFKLMTEPKGRILMQRANGLSPASKEYINIIQNQIPKMLGVGSTKLMGEQ